MKYEYYMRNNFHDIYRRSSKRAKRLYKWGEHSKRWLLSAFGANDLNSRECAFVKVEEGDVMLEVM